jgi:hypothetical protein
VGENKALDAVYCDSRCCGDLRLSGELDELEISDEALYRSALSSVAPRPTSLGAL